MNQNAWMRSQGVIINQIQDSATIQWYDIPVSTYDSYEEIWKCLEIGDALDYMSMNTEAFYSMIPEKHKQEMVIAIELIDNDNKLVILDSGIQLFLNRSRDGNSHLIDKDGHESYIVTTMFKRWIPADKSAASNIICDIDDDTLA